MRARTQAWKRGASASSDRASAYTPKSAALSRSQNLSVQTAAWPGRLRSSSIFLARLSADVSARKARTSSGRRQLTGDIEMQTAEERGVVGERRRRQVHRFELREHVRCRRSCAASRPGTPVAAGRGTTTRAALVRRLPAIAFARRLRQRPATAQSATVAVPRSSDSNEQNCVAIFGRAIGEAASALRRGKSRQAGTSSAGETWSSVTGAPAASAKLAPPAINVQECVVLRGCRPAVEPRRQWSVWPVACGRSRLAAGSLTIQPPPKRTRGRGGRSRPRVAPEQRQADPFCPFTAPVFSAAVAPEFAEQRVM